MTLCNCLLSSCNQCSRAKKRNDERVKTAAGNREDVKYEKAQKAQKKEKEKMLRERKRRGWKRKKRKRGTSIGIKGTRKGRACITIGRWVKGWRMIWIRISVIKYLTIFFLFCPCDSFFYFILFYQIDIKIWNWPRTWW